MTLLVLLVACWSSPSSELASQRKALDAWSEGAEAMASGDAAAARDHFDNALAIRPKDPILLSWRARAEAEAGDLQAAIATLDHTLDARPDFAEARYHRAMYLARAGRPEEAGPDLRRALDDGAATPREALEESDFDPYRDHDAFDFLPDSTLVVAVEPLPETAFRGSEIPVKATVAALTDPDGLVVQGLARGPIDLRRSVEDRIQGPNGTAVLLRWDLVLTGTGPVEVGPITFRLDGEQLTQALRTVEAVGPEEPAGEPGRWRLVSATELGRGLAMDRPVRRDDRVWVRTSVTSQVTTDPAGGVLAKHERRTAGQPDWVVWELRDVQQVTVRGEGGERFRGAPTDP